MKQRSVIAAAAIVLIGMSMSCGRTASPEMQKSNQELFAGTEGVERVGDTFRIKPGFEWAQKTLGTIAVQRPAGGSAPAPVVFLATCACETGKFACQVRFKDDSTAACQNVSDCLACKWRATEPDDLK